MHIGFDISQEMIDEALKIFISDTDKKGNLLIDLHNDDMKITMPETYQVINGVKKLLSAKALSQLL